MKTESFLKDLVFFFFLRLKKNPEKKVRFYENALDVRNV